MRPPAPDENARRCGHSLDADRSDLDHGVAVVADPLERERACLGRGGGKGDQGIRGHRGMQIDAIDLDAVVATGKPPDDVARDQLAQLRAAETGLHCVRGERLDLDDLAALRLRGNVDDRPCHQISPSSRQAESVTTTSALSDQNVPSESSAIATTVCVSARRTRVDMPARPARDPRWTLTTSGSGFLWVRTWIALTWSAAVIGLSTATESGTELPLSIKGGTCSSTLPARTGAPPTTFPSASS